MAVKFLDNTGLGYFWSKIKAWCNATFAAIAHTHTSYAVKHSYTTAANAAKNWYRIANANTSQTDTTKPIHAQFILTAYNASYDTGYYERWFVNAEVFGRTAHIVIFGNSDAPFSQARILYENTIADLDANDRPAIDIYLNYQLANGTTKIEIEEVYNSGWTFVANGQISASTVPTGFESQACDGIRGNGVLRSSYSDWASYTSLQRSNFSANFTLADNNTYRARVLNCTGTITVTVPSINSVNAWFIIKNFNTGSGNITIHPSTTSVLIDGSNDDIILRPTEYIMIHSKAANAYTIVFDGRRRFAMVGRSGTVGSDPKHWFLVAETTCTGTSQDPYISFKVFVGSGTTQCGGILSAHARIDATKGVVSSKQLQWEYKTQGISLEDFAITNIDTSGTSSKIQIWCKLTGAYSHYKFVVISEQPYGDATDVHTWNLTRARKTDGDIESLESGFTGVATSTLLTIANPISGNAATASAIAWSGITSKPTTISGYGITDAKIANGTITLGSNSITPLTSVPSHNQASDTINLLTGYSKPSTGSALATTDTLNQALGKLEAKVDTAVANSDGIPVGSVVWLSTSTVPIGFLLCNGQAVGRTTYPDLFSAIGTTYGSGDGSTTFNLPNLIDKFIEGANSNIGDSIAAGLPNITGDFTPYTEAPGYQHDAPVGAFYVVNATQKGFGNDGTDNDNERLGFDASRSNPIYGNSATVQPPALKLLPCIKAYSSVSNISELDVAQLENEVQNNFVHLTGDEVINGVKTFSNLHGWSNDYEATASIISIHNSLASRTETPLNACYNSIIFLDKTATNDYNYSARLGVSEIARETNGSIKHNLKVYSPDNRDNDYAMFQLEYKSGGTKHGKITVSSFEQESPANSCEYWLRIPSITINQSNPVNAGGVSSFIGLLDSNWKYVSYTKFSLSHVNQASVSFHLINPYNINNTAIINFSCGSGGWSYWWFGPNSINNNTINLGQAGGTWKQLYAGTAAINTSDKRVKNSIDYISDSILDIWDEVDFRQFKFNDAVEEKGDNARIHCGMVAQDIQEIFEKHHVDVTRYSFFCWDSWEAKEAVYNERGELESPASEAGDAYALRYEELLCLEAAYQRRKNKILENRISELERQVSDMLTLLQNLTNSNG